MMILVEIKCIHAATSGGCSSSSAQRGCRRSHKIFCRSGFDLLFRGNVHEVVFVIIIIVLFDEVECGN